jgi:3-oxoacyl-[acyl-carrier protein] reductase
MDLGLVGTVVCVTGASSGIGAACARLFAAEGADLVLAYHENARGAAETADAVRQRGRHAWAVRMDVRDEGSVREACAEVHALVPALDVLVHGAGENVITPFAEVTPAEWDQVVRTNLNGAFYVLHHARPLLREPASVILIASVAASTGAAHHAHYAAAKAGVVNLMKSAARALAPGVRVNCVSPGVTITPMGEQTIAALEPEYAERRLLARRYATPTRSPARSSSWRARLRASSTEPRST